MSYSIGRSGFGLNAAMARPKRQVRAELYISSPHAKAFFHLLHAQKPAIEQDLGYSLFWDELPDGKDTRISMALDEIDPEDVSDWPRQHQWLTERLNEFYRVFVSRVKAMNADAWQPEG